MARLRHDRIVLAWKEKTTMRIALIAPLIESVPPALYGGTERVVSVLAEELVARGHDVTLFASGDSSTSATLVPCAPRGLRMDPTVLDTVAYTMVEMGDVFARAADFDIIQGSPHETEKIVR